MPELPTLDEADLKGFDMSTWWGVSAPAIRTPEQFAAFVAGELKTYTELVRRSGAKAD